jgi:hypothetical protein
MTGDWRDVHNEELHDLYSLNIFSDQMKEDEMGCVCVLLRGEERCIQSFGEETQKKVTA